VIISKSNVDIMRGGVTTRAQAARQRVAAERAEPPSPNVAQVAQEPLPRSRSKTPSPPATTGPSTRRPGLPAKMTPAQCMEFIENPRMHPITRSKIIPGSGTYNKCLDECIKTLGDNSVPAIVASSIIKKANKTHKERADSEKACLRMINEFSEFNIERNATVLEVIDPFSQNNKLRKYALGSHEADIIREACESEFGIISLDILVPETDVRNIRIPVFLHHTNEGISISNFEDVRSHISEVVERWTRRTPARDDVYDAFIAAIQKIIDSRFLNGESRASLEDIVMELTAMKKGIVMGAKTPESYIISNGFCKP
jgi:hypothetical protein